MIRALVILGLGLVWSMLLAAQPVSKLILFGDSLSDNGNSYEYSHHNHPPEPDYYHGRFSNGPIWIDYVIDEIFSDKIHQQLVNYAFGGATVLQSFNHAVSLTQEVDSYLLTHPNKPKAKTWFIIWMGANDYMQDPLNSRLFVNKVLAEMQRNIERLCEHGAEHIIIMGLPDLGYAPFAKNFDFQTQLSKLVAMHNHALKKLIVNLQARFAATDFHYLDVNRVFNLMMTQSKRYGFTYNDEPCLEPRLDNYSIKTANKAGNSWLAQILSKHIQNKNCNEYLFLDQIHPTTLAHKIIAQQFLETIFYVPLAK